MALVLGDEELGARIARIRISNLRFADDISLLAESKGELQQLVNRVSQTSTRFGLIVSKPKTEVQCVGKGQTTVEVKILLEDEELEQVENFVYLGCTVSTDQSCDKDIERRIGLAAGIVKNLDKIWKARAITKGTKLMLYHTQVQAIVLYNAETWTLKEEHKRKLRVFETYDLRRICGITRRDRRRNVDIKQDLGVTLDIVQRVQRRRLTYFGHVARIWRTTDTRTYCYTRISWIWKWTTINRQTKEKVD